MTLGKTVANLESEEGLAELLDFLHQKGISYTSNNEIRVIKRLGLMAEMLGFKSYSDLLILLNTDPQTCSNLFKWLEKGKNYDEEEKSFSPLIQRNKSIIIPLDAPKKKKLEKPKKNDLLDWAKLHSSQENDDTKLESEKGLVELLDFLHQKKVVFTSKNKTRIIKRLKLITKRFSFKTYSELLNVLNTDPQTHNDVLNWLEQGRVYNEEENSFTPLVRRDKILKHSISLKKTREKLKKKAHKTRISDILPVFPDPTDTKNIPSIFNFLTKNNINYEAYKEKYFLRRVNSRMMRVDAKTYREYLEILESDPEEINLLVDNLSINVTHFFRDKDLWAKLDQEILPILSADRSKSIRIWSAGCAIGPEPYSIAILMNDRIKNVNLNNWHIFATDISQEFLNQAQSGVYSKDLLEEINPLEIQTFFNPISKELFQISADIRKKVTFKLQDLRKRPPFRGLDLIMCRNVLIYFSRSQSEALFRRFHSALRPKGYLILGKCELVPTTVRHLFDVVDAKTRIYRRKELEITV
ncbi:MAG: CheR family methyltransferase [Candidatus Hodarchaeales archaeon]|jgi:chemotaxis protein methyltransferase CheR